MKPNVSEVKIFDFFFLSFLTPILESEPMIYGDSGST